MDLDCALELRKDLFVVNSDSGGSWVNSEGEARRGSSNLGAILYTLRVVARSWTERQ